MQYTCVCVSVFSALSKQTDRSLQQEKNVQLEILVLFWHVSSFSLLYTNQLT